MIGCPTLDGEAGESMLCDQRAGIAEFIRGSGRCQSSLSDFGLFRFQVEESPDKRTVGGGRKWKTVSVCHRR